MLLKEYLNTLKNRISILIIIPVTFMIIASILSFFVIKPQYTSSISVYIVGNDNVNGVKLDYQQMLMYKDLVDTYGRFATSETVAEDIINELNLDESTDDIIDMISYSQEGSTQFLKLDVKCDDPVKSTLIVNQLAKSLKKVSISTINEDNIRILDLSKTPTEPSNSSPILNIIVSMILGIIVSLGIITLLEYIDNGIKNETELSSILEVPVLVSIPVYNNN